MSRTTCRIALAAVLIAPFASAATVYAQRDFALRFDDIEIALNVIDERHAAKAGERSIPLSDIEAFFLQGVGNEVYRGMARPPSVLAAGKPCRAQRHGDPMFADEPRGDVRLTRAGEPWTITLTKAPNGRIAMNLQFERDGIVDRPVEFTCGDGQALLVFVEPMPKVDEHRRCLLLVPKRIDSAAP